MRLRLLCCCLAAWLRWSGEVVRGGAAWLLGARITARRDDSDTSIRTLSLPGRNCCDCGCDCGANSVTSTGRAGRAHRASASAASSAARPCSCSSSAQAHRHTRAGDAAAVSEPFQEERETVQRACVKKSAHRRSEPWQIDERHRRLSRDGAVAQRSQHLDELIVEALQAAQSVGDEHRLLKRLRVQLQERRERERPSASVSGQ